MATITIYKLHSGFANIANDWSLEAVHVNEFRGDYAAVAELPDGFHAARSVDGDLAIYDARNRHYAVTSDDADTPVLVGAGRIIPLALVG